MKNRPVTGSRVSDEAASWSMRLDAGNLSSSEQEQLAKWLTESPDHVEELLIMNALWSTLDNIGQDISLPNLESTDVVHLDSIKATDIGNTSRFFPNMNIFKKLSIAATFTIGIAIVLLSTVTNNKNYHIESYATETGEQRNIVLGDGSTILLNTQSYLEVAYDENVRRVNIIEGEALFSVVQDENRPFRVGAGVAVFEAIGTQFNVNRKHKDVTMTVIEGVVSVSSQPQTTSDYARGEGSDDRQMPTNVPKTEVVVSAGQASLVKSDGTLAYLKEADIYQTIAWKERVLVFRDATLGYIAEEFNRYNETKIVITDKELAQTRLTAVLHAHRLDALFETLQTATHIHIDKVGEYKVFLRNVTNPKGV